MHACEYKHTVKHFKTSIHGITQHNLYLCSEIHLSRPGKMQNCGKVQAMNATYGASGNTSNTNTSMDCNSISYTMAQSTRG